MDAIIGKARNAKQSSKCPSTIKRRGGHAAVHKPNAAEEGDGPEDQ